MIQENGLFLANNSEDIAALKKTYQNIADQVSNRHVGLLFYGIPKKYPCKVQASFYTDDITPPSVFFTFHYLVDDVCPCCNQKVSHWRTE